MSKITNGEIILTKEESEQFKDAMIYHNTDSIKKRDAFLNDDSIGTITVNFDGTGTITTKEKTEIYKKVIPVVNPNYQIEETPEELLNVVNQKPIPIVDVDLSDAKFANGNIPKEHIIGCTIPNTATTLALYCIYSKVAWLDEKYANDYAWDNALISIDSDSLNLAAFVLPDDKGTFTRPNGITVELR